jgi:hypothetical protein
MTTKKKQEPKNRATFIDEMVSSAVCSRIEALEARVADTAKLRDDAKVVINEFSRYVGAKNKVESLEEAVACMSSRLNGMNKDQANDRGRLEKHMNDIQSLQTKQKDQERLNIRFMNDIHELQDKAKKSPAPAKRKETMWVNIYRDKSTGSLYTGNPQSTKSGAESSINPYDRFIKTISFEVEE